MSVESHMGPVKPPNGCQNPLINCQSSLWIVWLGWQRPKTKVYAGAMLKKNHIFALLLKSFYVYANNPGYFP